MKREILAAIALTAAMTGCRRTDVREFQVEIPDLAPSMSNTVRSAFFISDPMSPTRGRWCDGVMVQDIKFDYDRHELTVRYDSMKIAQTNIRMLLESKGLKVVYPENKTGRAGH